MPTGCTGWAVRDLVLHRLQDAQRALVVLHTPAHGPADRDAVTYWRDRRPDTAGAANGRRRVRVNGCMFLDFGRPRGLYVETPAAAAHAAATVPPGTRVATQGHVLTAGGPSAGPASPPCRNGATRTARVGTGRAALTDAERTAPGQAADRFPLVG
ncbi:maleylpyruvate isomerase N-terminal domain-containing protein [Streptomyces sp. NPDC006309]|uniref:maleylpyruvate isomerase N-terminal domain-containing protein n=1 Tax=Streptomyces sp. NPDC006309 TaxID=3156749 RepID=UPI0033B7E862